MAPDGRNLAFANGSRGELFDWSRSVRRFQLLGHGDDVIDFVFADGRSLATASKDRTVRLWSVATGQELLVLSGHSGSVRRSPFHQMAASSPPAATVLTAE